MNSKRILVADADIGAVQQFSQALGGRWKIVPAINGTVALTRMYEHPCQVVVASMDLPELDGAEVLKRIRRKYPNTVRFLASGEADKQRLLKAADGAHQFLSKPYDASVIKDAIERALAIDTWISSERVREFIASVRALPTLPTLYTEVVAALRSEHCTTEQVGAIIASDMAMMTKMLQLLNSACFGLNREISDPAEAVGILGFETVKTMVMAIKLLNRYDKLKVSDFSMERLWKHSTAVAQTARQLTLLETSDRALADAAFTAGLLHDLGKVVLAANFEDNYSGALLLGYKQGLAACDVETEVFGAHHGEIGAYLLGLWGMPLNLLETTALHHAPARSENKAFCPLTAVHVANVFERELCPDELGMISPKLDEGYLDGLGLLHRVEAWREAVFNRDGNNLQPKAKVKRTVKLQLVAPPEPPAVAPATSEPSAASQPPLEPAGRSSSTNWLIVGAGVCVLLLVGWLAAEKLAGRSASRQTTDSVANTTPAAPDGPAVTVAPLPAADHPESAVKPSDLAPAKPAADSASGIPFLSPMVVRARDTTNEPAAASVPKPIAFSDLKLQAIFFSTRDPSAILSGKTVRVNDRISGARVVSISSSNLTLEFQNQRKTLSIK